ncbi:MAG: hypothetical protein ACTSQ9_03905 [Candidatus Hodarchaeales archaeon]
MTNLLQDPSVVIYDKLFFGLTLGKYDLHISTESGLLEEFLIVREKHYCDLSLFERILPYHLQKAFHEVSYEPQKQFLQSNGLIIDFITYSSSKNNEMIGLSLRVITNDKFALTFLGASSEKRIQKIMFLLSRGLLKSSFHQINQKSIKLKLE